MAHKRGLARVVTQIVGVEGLKGMVYTLLIAQTYRQHKKHELPAFLTAQALAQRPIDEDHLSGLFVAEKVSGMWVGMKDSFVILGKEWHREQGFNETSGHTATFPGRKE